jgi:hypothetical protein
MRKDWKNYYEIKDELNHYDNYTKQIVDSFGISLNGFFGKNRSEKTQLLKAKLTEVGRKLGFKSYSNKLPLEMTQAGGGEEKNKEWMWDIHWFTEDEKISYTPITIPMVGEIEWDNNKDNRAIPYSSVMDDFQKLVVSNAELRLLVFCLKEENDFTYLDHYFENLVYKKYKHFHGREKFLFIAYFTPGRTFFVREIVLRKR